MQTRHQLELGSATVPVAIIGVSPMTPGMHSAGRRGAARETHALLIPSARLRQPMPARASDFTPPRGGYWPAGATRLCKPLPTFPEIFYSAPLRLSGKKHLKNKEKPGENRPEPTKK